jgi:hypothetical protein
MIRRARLLIITLCLVAVPVFAGQPPTTEEFRPLSELPPSEQLPGGVFLVAAYAFIWVATMIYVWWVYARLKKVEEDMKALERRVAPESGRR